MINQLLQKFNGDQFVTIFVGTFSILGIVIGWGLNSLNSYLINRKETKDAIGVAIAILLVIRQRYLKSEDILDVFVKKYNLTEEQRKQFIQGLINFNLDGLIKLEEEYSEAVKKISAVDPILGQKLISKMFFEETLTEMIKKSNQDERFRVFWHSTAFDLMKAIRVKLDEVILELAANYGSLKKILLKEVEVSPEMDIWVKKTLEMSMRN